MNMKIIELDYSTKFLVPEYRVSAWVEILADAKKVDYQCEVNEIEYTVKNAPDFAYEALKKQAREEVKDTLQKEVDQKTKYWLDTINERDKLKKEVADLQDRLDRIVNATKGDPLEDF